MLSDHSPSDLDTKDDTQGHAPKAQPLLLNTPGALLEHLGTSQSMHIHQGEGGSVFSPPKKYKQLPYVNDL